MHNRPIRRQYRGPQTATSRPPATGGEYLGELIAEVDALRQELGFSRWSHLRPWCDAGDPTTTDGDGLERLLERLTIVAVNRGLFPPDPTLSNNVQNPLEV